MSASIDKNKKLVIADVIQSFTLREALDFGDVIATAVELAGFQWGVIDGEVRFNVAEKLEEWAAEEVRKFETKEAAE